MRTSLCFILGLGALASAGAQGSGLSPEALLKGLDQNEISTTSHSLGTIEVQDRFGKKVSGFEAWAQGTEKSLIVFTSGEEKGQKILRLKETLYVFYPEADKPVKIQGAALKDSVAGSDFSYEDMAGDRSLSARYAPRILGQETIAGEICTILELRALKSGLAYPMLKIWVNPLNFSSRKIEKYSQNERLLKTMEVLEVMKAGTHILASKTIMSDIMKGKSKTTFTLTKAELDIPLKSSQFSLEELTW